jgi:hypothetical protein
MDKSAAVAARRRLRQAALDHGWIIASGHFLEEHVFGRVERHGDGLAYRPLDLST